MSNCGLANATLNPPVLRENLWEGWLSLANATLNPPVQRKNLSEGWLSLANATLNPPVLRENLWEGWLSIKCVSIHSRDTKTSNIIATVITILIDWFTSHPTQNRSFWGRSSQPLSWLSTEKLKQTTKANMHTQQHILQHKTNPKTKAKFGLVASYDLCPWKRNGSILEGVDRWVKK